jgi:hypothetical protein
MRWYRDKKCVYCRKAFPELHWVDHRPALRTPDGNLLAWNEVTMDSLRDVLATHSAVCWDCYIAQDFRLNHPDLVVFRPERNGVYGGVGGSPTSR